MNDHEGWTVTYQPSSSAAAETARALKSVDILSAAAQLYETSYLTRRIALSCDIKNIAGRFFGLATKHTCDRRTDGQTDRIKLTTSK